MGHTGISQTTVLYFVGAIPLNIDAKSQKIKFRVLTVIPRLPDCQGNFRSFRNSVP
jgi:hypothetical protein